MYDSDRERWVEPELECCWARRILKQAYVGEGTGLVELPLRDALTRAFKLDLCVKVRTIALKYVSFDVAASIANQYLCEVSKGRDLWSSSENPFELAEHVFDDDLEFPVSQRADDQLFESVLNYLIKHWARLRDPNAQMQSVGARAVQKWLAVRPWIVLKIVDVMSQHRNELRDRLEEFKLRLSGTMEGLQVITRGLTHGTGDVD